MDKLRYYGLDASHPIPNLDVVDVNVVKTTGGSDLILNIASPLRGDARSLERLLYKIERYLGFAKSAAFVAESGIATVANTRILVRIHPHSSNLAFAILERCKPWAIANQVTLEFETCGIDDSLN